MRRHGHAKVNPKSPRAFATCDRCSRLFNHDDLQWEQQWVGRSLQNLRLLVCDTCLDVPQEQLRIIVLPPDPLPIHDPRPELADIQSVVPSPPTQHIALPALRGTYHMVGSTATMRVSIHMTLAPGAYGLTGNAAAVDFFPGPSGLRAFSPGFDSGFS